MSNKQTTWELKAVDNLSEVILRMEQMVKLQQQQAALSSTASRDIQIQMNGVASSYKSVETAIDKATTASKEQATETANVKSKFDALKSTVTPLTTIISNVYAGAKSKEFISEITQVDGKVNVLSKSFTEIISDVQKYSNEAKSAFAQVKAATDGARITDVTYQQQIEGRVVSTLEKIGRIEARMQELAAKQSQLANKEQAETAQLIQQKELIIAKIDKINLTYGSLGARTEQQQEQWDSALRKTYAELDKVEGKIEQMPNKTAAENAKLEKQFDSLTTQVKGAVSSLVSAENQLEKLGVESQKSEGYIGKLRAEVDRLKELRGFAKTEEEVRALNVELNKAETNLQEIEGGGKKITDSFSSIKGTLAAFLGIYELISAVKAIFDLTAQWEKYEAVLKTALGSQELATRSLEMLQSFADKTNFTLDELADTFIKFANRGLIVTQNELTKVGDVANALGKPFKDLGEAILDINNTERWNELGIKAKTAGDQVSLTFKGVTIEVDKTEKGVLSAITAFGTMNGVQGQTAAQALTLSGRLSTLQDSAAGLGRTIGESMTPAFGGAIDYAGAFIKTIAGSGSAFERTLDYLKAVAAGLVTYQLAANAAAIKTEVLSVAMAAKEVVMKAYNIAVGTTQLVVSALSTSMGANTIATTAATTAARSFWAALAANPIGLIVTAIGVATTAYYAWKASQDEVNVVIDAATEKLIKEKVELTAAVQAVQAYSMGTDERTAAVQGLMDKYPELLGYVEADTVTNVALNAALAQQISLLDAKIKYTAAAAQADVVYEKQKVIYSEQTAIVIKLRGAYKELSEAYPDNDKFVAAIEKSMIAENSRAAAVQNTGTAAMTASWATMKYAEETSKYTELGKQATSMQSEMALATTEVSKASAASTNAQIDDINKQLVALDAAHKSKRVSDDVYEVRRQELLQKLAKLNQDEVDDEVKKVVKLGDSHKVKKEQAFMSATEISKLTKEIQEESLKSQIELIEINMKIEIDLINNHKNSKIKTEAEAQEAIKSIIAKAEKDKEELLNDSRVKIQATELAHKDKVVELANKLVLDVQASEVQRIMNTQLSADERAKIDADTLVKIEASRQREQEIIRETEAIEKDAHRERLKSIIGFLGQMNPELQQFATFALNVVDNIGLITGKSEQFYQKQAQDAATAMETSRIFYGETSTQYAVAKEKSAEANKNLAESQAAASAASANMAMALAEIVQQVMGAISNTIASSMAGINESLELTKEAFQRFTDLSIDLNRQMIERVLEDTSKSTDERKALIDEFMQHEKDTLYGNERMQNELNTIQNTVNLAQWSTERQSEFINNLTKGPTGIIENWKLVLNWKKSQAQQEEELARQQTIFEQNQAISRAQQQIETYKQMADEKIKLAEEMRDKEIEAAKKTNETIGNELELLDSKRKRLLDSWLERKLKDLEDDKRLALEQAETEEEKSNIIIKYQSLVEDAHKEHKQAELDKSKQVALATTELKAQETDFIKNKESETGETIRNIQRQTTDMIRQANNEIFEANKQIIIAELQGEIAKLKAKRWFMNAGKVDAAVSTIEGVIASIQGASLGGGVNTGGIDGDMGTNEKYEESGRKANEIAEKAREALQSVDQSLMDARSKTGEIDGQLQEARRKAEEAGRISIVVPKDENGVPLAEGTAYVEGFGYPDGRDTVPAWIDKGERILSKSLNALLGGRSVTNEELVAKKIFADKVLERSGSLKTSTLLGPLPIALMSGASGGNNGQWEQIANKIVESVNKPNININASPYGLTVEEIGRNRQHKTYYKNTPFAKLTP